MDGTSPVNAERGIDMPGIALDKAESDAFMDRFAAAFLSKGINWRDRRNFRPFWVRFSAELKSLPITRSQLPPEVHRSLLEEYLLNVAVFYVLNGKNVYRTTGKEILTFLDQKPRWFESDFYFLPVDMDSCLVCTHDDVLFLVYSPLSVGTGCTVVRNDAILGSERCAG